MPLSCGMPMSRIRRSGWCSSVSRIASRPSAASATIDEVRSPRAGCATRGARSRDRQPAARASGTSGTATRERDVDREGRPRPARPLIVIDAVELLDPFVDAAQAEAVAPLRGFEPDRRRPSRLRPAGWRRRSRHIVTAVARAWRTQLVNASCTAR